MEDRSMPTPTIVLYNRFNDPKNNTGSIFLDNNNDTVILRLKATRDDGVKYVILGKVVIQNIDGNDAQNATARLVTDDGKTELDKANVRIAKQDGNDVGAQSVSLQGMLDLSTEDNIVDLRCSLPHPGGNAIEAELFAIPVDNFKFSPV
jgi:hypothetical protein